eukprot:CAMPEP_0203943086 /NCGR_PEP_ID=MMETSP0359-20131031/79138_1 /ASSEMBLY_ACC=CAM_ASM_000338 /TAXON_ID=268821 /ORGANISM="Scrippsiella Hangoei, Strain SHTV-5" /LENGTH=50 /DNA_ID=CAMNT_0050873901 /DNA_START=74 /DNA_END=222 /DNA_ORIENTATION=-
MGAGDARRYRGTGPQKGHRICANPTKLCAKKTKQPRSPPTTTTTPKKGEP